MTQGPLARCVFFDRDGIVNVSPGPGYVERPEDFHLQATFLDALRVVLGRGYEAVIVTNQRGVGLGRFSPQTLDRIHERMRSEVEQEGLRLLDVLVCADVHDDSPDRKPNPGMLLRAAEVHGLDLPSSWMVGDQERDVLAGKRAGCRTILVEPADVETVADFQVRSMADLPGILTSRLDPLLPRAH
jgi:histidinol-phosphate phosphatase family protein